MSLCTNHAFAVSAQSLHDLAHLLPPSAAELVRTLGVDAAAKLVNGLPGVQLVVPKHPDANPAGARRWALLAAMVGEAAMPALAGTYGGQLLDVPTCNLLRLEQRNRWVRSRFDEHTANPGGASRATAVYEIGIELARCGWVMTYRQIERVLDQPDATPETTVAHRRHDKQRALFEDAPL